MKKKKIKIVSGVFIVLVSLFLLGSPLLIKNLLVSNGEQWLGRKISLKELKINFFTSKVQLIDFKMYEDDKTTTFVAFDTLLLDAEPYQYFTSKIVVEQLYLKSLKTRIVKENDSLFNFDSLIAFFQSPKDTVLKEEEISDEFKFSFSNIEFVNADLQFEDKVVDENFEIDAINFLIPNIEWNQEETSNADLRFSFTDGGSFTSSTEFDPVLGDFSTLIKIDSLAINTFENYVKNALVFNEINGFLSSELTFKGSTKALNKMGVHGALAISGFSLTNEANSPVFSFDKLHCPIVNIKPLSQYFEFGDIRLEAPFINFIKFRNDTNLDRMLKKEAAETPTKEQSNAENKLYYALASFSIDKGVVSLNDRTTSKPFQYEISNLQMHLDTLNSHSNWLKTQTNLVMNKRGKLAIDLNFNPNNATREMDMSYDISGLKLKDWSIYSEDYMGVPIYKGEMFYKAKTSVFNNKLKSENKVIIHNVDLGEKNGGEYNVPIKFAMFLLKDNHGVVRMDVPVEGDIEKSDVEIKGIIWDAFKNLIIRTAASPTKLLAGLVGGNKEDLEVITYQYLDTIVGEGQQKQVKMLQSLKRKKKGLEVSLKYKIDLEEEKKQLALARAKEKYLKKKNLEVVEDKNDFENYLNKKAKTEGLSVEEAALHLIEPEELHMLGEQYSKSRIAQMQNCLNALNLKDSLTIAVQKEYSEDNLPLVPQFVIEYKILE